MFIANIFNVNHDECEICLVTDDMTNPEPVMLAQLLKIYAIPFIVALNESQVFKIAFVLAEDSVLAKELSRLGFLAQGLNDAIANM